MQDMNETVIKAYYGTIGRKTPHKGHFGIEIEVEYGEKEPVYLNTSLWTAKTEHSLRRGIEFVTKGIVVYRSLRWKKTLNELSKYYDKWSDTLQTSIRTSTHIHFNVQNYTLKQVFNMIINYYLFENFLMYRNGKNRRGNLHCLGLSRCNGLLEAIPKAYQDGVFFRAFSQDGFKYAALNIAAVRKYGSLEFRFIRTSVDPELKELKIYCNIFYRLLPMLAELDPSELLKLYTDNTLTDFLRMFLTPKQINFLKYDSDEDSIMPLAKVRSLFEENEEDVHNLALGLKKEGKKYSYKELFKERIGNFAY